MNTWSVDWACTCLSWWWHWINTITSFLSRKPQHLNISSILMASICVIILLCIYLFRKDFSHWVPALSNIINTIHDPTDWDSFRSHWIIQTWSWVHILRELGMVQTNSLFLSVFWFHQITLGQNMTLESFLMNKLFTVNIFLKEECFLFPIIMYAKTKIEVNSKMMLKDHQ